MADEREQARLKAVSLKEQAEKCIDKADEAEDAGRDIPAQKLYTQGHDLLDKVTALETKWGFKLS